jgi:hypothetical protein
MKTYYLKYSVFKDSEVLKDNGEIKIHNCYNEFGAKCKLDNYCQKKYPDMTKLEVYSCERCTNIGDYKNVIQDMNDLFGGIFK